jgi:glutamate dehydrogenase/leucine dehydrogenase
VKWTDPPAALSQAMRDAGVRRAYFVTDAQSGELRASLPALEPLVQTLREHPDYFMHQGCFFELGEESGHLLSAAVHKTRRGQAAGGVRFWRYETLGEFIRDGLRLARGMGQKNALAGLWWGGGKGVIARQDGVDHKDPELRGKLYRDYGRFMTGLRGCYVTAEDVGTTPPDMANIFVTTRHTTCIPEAVGGSGNPSQLTARGVVVGMEAALDQLELGSLEGKTVAVQGLGNVSRFMVAELLERKVAKIIGADIEQGVLDELLAAHPGAPLELRVVALDDMSILAEEVDVVAPNATGATLNQQTIPTIRAKVVCGAANNQLELTERDGRALRDAGVLYVPDFLTNRMGIVNCANEAYGSFDGDPAIQAHLEREPEHGIFARAQQIFARAAKSGLSTAEEAEALAEELMDVPHPIWPERSQQIIDSLVASGWDRA